MIPKCVKSLKNFPYRVLIASIVICFGGSFNYGYQGTVLNPTEPVFRRFLNESFGEHYGYQIEDEEIWRLLWSVVLNARAIGGCVGVFFIVQLTEKIGTRKTLFISTLTILIGLICQCVSKWAHSFELLTVGRFVTALGTVISLAIESMYLNEISPDHLRGLFCSMTGIFTSLGYLSGAILGISGLLGTESRWPWLFVVEIPSVLMLLVAIPLFIRESPHFLHSQGRVQECKEVLKFYQHRDIDKEMEEIEKATKLQQDRLTYTDIWKKTYLRKAVFLCVLVSLAANLSGLTYVSYLSDNILENIGLEEKTAQFALIAIFAPAFLASFFGSCLTQYSGRRPLLIWTTGSFILTNICVFAFSLAHERLDLKWAGYAVVVACAILILMLGVGPTMLQWTLAAEMVPQNAKSKNQAIVLVIQKFTSLIEGLAFYPVEGLVGSYVFVFYIILSAGIFGVLLKMFPETKDKDTEEVMRELGYKEGRKDEGGKGGKGQSQGGKMGGDAHILKISID